jgi:hypothetical protein
MPYSSQNDPVFHNKNRKIVERRYEWDISAEENMELETAETQVGNAECVGRKPK